MAFTINLKDKVVIITGVSSGIGAGIAKMFARANALIAGCALEDENAEGVRSFFLDVEKESGNQPLYFQCDLTKAGEMEKFVNKVHERFGRIDILASNAGANFFRGAANCSDVDWNRNLELNLVSHWKLAKSCKKYLEAHNSGVIIITASCHAYATMPGCFPYNIAKAGLKAMVQSLTLEWSPAIRTVGLAPGFIDTKLAQEWFDSFPDPEEENNRTKKLMPLERFGTPDEIGAWAVFLASDYAAFTGGQTFLIDGGLSSKLM